MRFAAVMLNKRKSAKMFTIDILQPVHAAFQPPINHHLKLTAWAASTSSPSPLDERWAAGRGWPYKLLRSSIFKLTGYLVSKG
jgi:hypothetical protein